MKNTILCKGRDVFIINFDKTILLSFLIKSGIEEFKDEIVFDANDYDSNIFAAEGDQIVFTIVQDGYLRKKKCGTNKALDFETISTLYYKMAQKKKKATSYFVLRREVMGLLQDDLSHVEISNNKGELKITQRDIFSGTIIEIENYKTGLDLVDTGKLAPFEPMGIRTVDLDALFEKDRELVFHFIPNLNYFIVEGKTTNMTGILSWALYDELGRINLINK